MAVSSGRYACLDRVARVCGPVVTTSLDSFLEIPMCKKNSVFN